MTGLYDLIESDAWPAIRIRIAAERDRRIHGLLYVGGMESLKKEQGFIEALDWVIEEGKPKPQRRREEDED